jgi:hypothetical protein
VALVLALSGRFYSGLSGPGEKLFDRNDPRSFVETLKKSDLDEKVRRSGRTIEDHAR